jgi:hypothetical protein
LMLEEGADIKSYDVAAVPSPPPGGMGSHQ